MYYELTLVLNLLSDKKDEIVLIDWWLNPYAFSLPNSKSCCRLSMFWIDESHFPYAPKMHHISLICQDASSILQTLQLMNVEKYKPFRKTVLIFR